MTTLSTIPQFPALSDRAAGTYNSKAYAFGAHMGGPFVGEINAVRNEVEALNEGAVISAASASSASAAALANANYKGDWSALTGALAVPASFSYLGELYMLLNSVSNITGHIPGVSINIARIQYTQSVELIQTVYAAAVATVAWTNFETLAAEYSCLRLVADGLIGSAASANLNGQIKISNTWQPASSWQGNIYPTIGGVSIGSQGQLKNVASKVISLDISIYSLGIIQQPAVVVTNFGGHDGFSGYTALLHVGSSFSTNVAPTTAIQGLSISASTGTLTGTFRLYGVRK